MRQKSGQLELALEARGETHHGQRSGEAPTTSRGDDGSGGDHRLMERVVARANALAALKRVKQNKGGPGVDGMTAATRVVRVVAPCVRRTRYSPGARRWPAPRSSGGARVGGTNSRGIRTVHQRIYMTHARQGRNRSRRGRLRTCSG